MLINIHKIKGVLRFGGIAGLLFAFVHTKAEKKPDLDGEVTTYVSIHSAKEISGLGVASIYNQKSFCQLRYNYEDSRTFSFYWGRPVVKQGKNFYVQLVPTIGLSAGNFMGVSPSVQLFAEVGQFEVYSSSQTSVCVTNVNRSFFFNWTEALYKYKNIFKVGAAVQYTKQYPPLQRNKELAQAPVMQQVDVGPVVGVQYWRFYLSGYFFNVWDAQRHYAVSLTYNFR